MGKVIGLEEKLDEIIDTELRDLWAVIDECNEAIFQFTKKLEAARERGEKLKERVKRVEDRNKGS